MNKNTEQLVYKHLLALGVDLSGKGYVYLKNAICRVLDEPSRINSVGKSIYTPIAKENGATYAGVDRCIRYSIAQVFANSPQEVLIRYFGESTVMNEKGTISNTAFIGAVAEYIRMNELTPEGVAV